MGRSSGYRFGSMHPALAVGGSVVLCLPLYLAIVVLGRPHGSPSLPESLYIALLISPWIVSAIFLILTTHNLDLPPVRRGLLIVMSAICAPLVSVYMINFIVFVVLMLRMLGGGARQ